MKTLIAIAIATALSGGSAIANAQDVATARVTTADLNLDAKAGMQTLAQRVAVASRTVCGSPSSGASLATNRATAACRAQATHTAMQRYDARQIASN